MSPVIVEDGALVLQDPADQRRYTVDWSRTLPAGVIINEIPTFGLRSRNAAADALFKTVASFVFDGVSTATITTTTPHGYAFLDYVTISGAHEPAANFTNLVLSVLSPTVFTLPCSGIGAFTATGVLTAATGIDWTDYTAQTAQVRFTNGVRGAQYEITVRIVTSDSPAQVKTRSFQILIEDL